MLRVFISAAVVGRLATGFATSTGARGLSMMAALPEKKTSLVTGSTAGIGEHTAAKIAQEGKHIVCIHGRDPKRVEESIERIKGYAMYPEEVLGVCADISTLAGMESLCEQVKKIFPDGLDVLINNAGVFEKEYRKTEDGIEFTFAVNVVAPFVITRLLIQQLKKRRQARIVNVSSISQASSLDFDNLQFEKGGYSAHAAYGLSKLAVAMFSAELASRVDPTDAAVNSLDPGTVNTKMLEAGWGMCGMPVSRANDEFWLACAPEAAAAHGRYFVGRRDSRPSAPVTDLESRQRLWSYLEDLTGVKYPRSN